MKRLHSPRTLSAQAFLAVGTASTAIGGALVMVFSAPVASATDGSLQPVIDQILEEMQAAVTADRGLAFATPANDAMLTVGEQNSEFEELTTLLGHVTSSTFMAQLPEVVAGDAANSRLMFAGDNPDTFYSIGDLASGATYVLTGKVGAGTANLAINPYSTSFALGSGPALDHGLVVNPDGTFTIDIGPTEPSGAVNYLDDAGYNLVLIRDTISNWGLGADTGSLSLQCIADCPATTSGELSSAEIGSLLNSLGSATPFLNEVDMISAEDGGIELPANTMSALASEANVPGGLPSTIDSAGNFDLQPGQALIVEVPNVTSAYSGIEIESAFAQTLPYTLAQTSLNNTQAFVDPSGDTYYVISATNPGVANWLDTGGLSNGEVFVRFENVPTGSDATGLDVTTQVVPVADVRQYLPADTPTVNPAEYAAEMTGRVLSYDYALDTSRNTSWVTEQLWLRDIQAAMGTAQFHAVFGTQPSTPMWLRLTPALSPNYLAVAKDLLTNPTGSLTAIQHNLPLAGQDVYLPAILAQELLQQDFTQTAQAVQGDLSSGQPLQALAALFSGDERLGSIVYDALFNPNTSITAGILNARDDLATAVFTANGGFPSQAGPLATLEWNYLPELVQLTPNTMMSDFVSQLNPAALASDLSRVLNPADFAMLFDPAAIGATMGGLAAELPTIALSIFP